MDHLLLALILIVIAAVLVGVDMFLPTGGILAVLAAVAAVGAVVCGFLHSVAAGSWIGIGVLAAIPLSFWIFVKIYPNTPIGRQMIMQPHDAEPYDFGGGGRNSRESLVNQIGLAATDLSPSGVITIDAKRFEASSIDGLIRAGTAIRVRDVEMGLLSVEVYRDPLPGMSGESPEGSDSPVSHSSRSSHLAAAPQPATTSAEHRPLTTGAHEPDGQTDIVHSSLLDVPTDVFAVDELREGETSTGDKSDGSHETRSTGRSHGH